jgi:hypothetical protein
MLSKHSSRIGTLDENMKAFLARQIFHIIACHTVSNPFKPFPRPAAKQNIPIDTKRSGCTNELKPNHLNILYHNPLAKGHVPNKWPSDSAIDGHHLQSDCCISVKTPLLWRVSFVGIRPRRNSQEKTITLEEA